MNRKNTLPIDPKKSNLAIPLTSYALFLYLLSQDLDTIEETRYLLRLGVMAKRDYKLKHYIWYRDIQKLDDFDVLQSKSPIISQLYLAIHLWQLHRQLKKQLKSFLGAKSSNFNIFTNCDPIVDTIPQILEGEPFIHIEDGTGSMLPEAFDFSKRRKDSHGILALIPQLKASQLIGRIVVHSDGANTPNIPCLHIGVEEAWETSSPEKRHRIMEIFGITPTDLEILQGRDSILLNPSC